MGTWWDPKGQGESLSMLAVRVNTNLIAHSKSSIHLAPEYFFPYKICYYPIILFVKGFSVIFPFCFNFFCLYQTYSVISLGFSYFISKFSCDVSNFLLLYSYLLTFWAEISFLVLPCYWKSVFSCQPFFLLPKACIGLKKIQETGKHF